MSHGPTDEPQHGRPGGGRDQRHERHGDESRDAAREEPRDPRPDDAGTAIRRARARPAEERGAGSAGVPASASEEKGPSAASYAGLGFQFLGAILLFLYLGRWLDARLGTSPWLLVAGVFVGTSAGFYSLYRKLMKEQAKEDARRAARSAEGQRR